MRFSPALALPLLFAGLFVTGSAAAEPAAYALKQVAAAQTAKTAGQFHGWALRCGEADPGPSKIRLLEEFQKAGLDDSDLLALSTLFERGAARGGRMPCDHRTRDALRAEASDAEQEFTRITPQPAARIVKQTLAAQAAKAFGRLAGYAARCYGADPGEHKVGFLEMLDDSGIGEADLIALSAAFDLNAHRAEEIPCDAATSKAMEAETVRIMQDFRRTNARR